MNLSPKIQQRIYEAADELYDGSGRSAFPTVDAVRRLSKTNMNDASVAMRAWRGAQGTANRTVAVTIPDAVRRVHDDALGTLWNAAQELGNAGLRAAQAGWEAERVESETVRAQLASAFDEQATELAQAQRGRQELMDALDASKAAAEGARLEIVTLTDECRALRADATATARVIIEMQGRIADTHDELDKSNARTIGVQHELDAVREATQRELVELKTALADATSQTASAIAQEKAVRKEQAQAHLALLEARDAASVLRGQVDALTRQNTELFDALKPIRRVAERHIPSAEDSKK
jgi:colicin import membrane protein